MLEPCGRACLERMELYHEDTRNGFKYTLGWLHQWACSRSFGLGALCASVHLHLLLSWLCSFLPVNTWHPFAVNRHFIRHSTAAGLH